MGDLPVEETSSATGHYFMEEENTATLNTNPEVFQVERNLNAVSIPHPLLLSVFPVLRLFLMMLEDEDLETCRDVCKSWRVVAKSMTLVHYEILLGRPYLNPKKFCGWEKDWVSLKKWIRRRNRGRRFTEFETNFKDTMKTLKEDVERSHVSMSLKVDEHTHLRGPRAKLIINNFGHLVVDLEYYCNASLSLNWFCRLLVQGLPNLKILNFSAIFYDEDYLAVESNFNTDMPQNKHKNLKRIYFGRYTNCKYQSLGKLFKMAVNLEEIHDLPIWLVNSVEIAGIGSVLKSITCDFEHPKGLSNIYKKGDLGEAFSQNGMTVVSSLEKLAQLKPELISSKLLQQLHLQQIIY